MPRDFLEGPGLDLDRMGLLAYGAGGGGGYSPEQRSLAEVLRTIAGVPVLLPPDGWPPSSAQLFDQMSSKAGVTATSSFVTIASFTVPQGLLGYLGAFGIGVSDFSDPTNVAARLLTPGDNPYVSECAQLLVSGFPRCTTRGHFPLQGGDTVSLQMSYAGVVAPMLFYARLRGWTWQPTVRADGTAGRLAP